MVPVSGEQGLWSHDLWIMTRSVYAVHVAVDGPDGPASLVVPAQFAPTRTLAMSGGMTAGLLVLGGLLVAGVLSIAGAAARESTLPAGDAPDPRRVRRGRFAAATATAFAALALFGGSRWWQAEEAAYRRSMDRLYDVETTVANVDGQRVLTLAITDSVWFDPRMPPTIPDHGKMMHLFATRLPDHDATMHLHPVRESVDRYRARLPDVPAGEYLVYADVVHDNGFLRTFVDTMTVSADGADASPAEAGESRDGAAAASSRVAELGAGMVADVEEPAAAAGLPAADPDDAWAMVADGSGTRTLSDGATLTLSLDGPETTGRDLALTAQLTAADGSAEPLEPYLGMAGHAFVLRRDGQVFMHLHPSGTSSMVAKEVLLRLERGDTLEADSGDMPAMEGAGMAMPDMEPAVGAMGGMEGMAGMGGSPDGRVSFPFTFSTPGEYRLYVQVKRGGVVETIALDAQVTDGGVGL
jgi:hypothetical protein